MSCAGTTYFPKLEGRVLLLEEMSMDLGVKEVVQGTKNRGSQT